jgi:hypothetical protein
LDGTGIAIDMGKLEEKLDQAVKEGKVPHAVVFATNRDGIRTHICRRSDANTLTIR